MDRELLAPASILLQLLFAHLQADDNFILRPMFTLFQKDGLINLLPHAGAPAPVAEFNLAVKILLGDDVLCLIDHGYEKRHLRVGAVKRRTALSDDIDHGLNSDTAIGILAARFNVLDTCLVQYIGQVTALAIAVPGHLGGVIEQGNPRTELWIIGLEHAASRQQYRAETHQCHGTTEAASFFHFFHANLYQSLFGVYRVNRFLGPFHNGAIRLKDSMNEISKQPVTILLAAPRGFCAGVDRAIQIVELALQRYGKPIYVRHEIVHNRYVVEGLERRGAVFVDELDQVPDDGMVIFSAHGVAKSVPEDARRRGLSFLDATCPLVAKVHSEAENHHAKGRHVVMLGHAGHPEAVGTMGQLAPGEITLLQSADEAAAFIPPDDAQVAYITQTTLSVDDTAAAIKVLGERFPDLAGPRKGDICYATTNRQAAVKAIAGRCDGLFVIGAPNSSNSKRLVEVADSAGCGYSQLIQRAGDIVWADLAGQNCIGISAGASAPEVLVEEVLDAFHQRFSVTIEQVAVANEDKEFKLPAELRAPEPV